MARKLRYRNFADRLDVDALEEAIGFDVISSTDEEDTGYCFDLYGLHTHGDTTGKLSINRDKKVYNCWVCGGGSLLSLVMDMKDFDGEQATEFLARFADVEESEEETGDRLKAMLRRTEDKEERPLPYFNEHVLSRFELPDEEWLNERGIDRITAEEYELRFNPKAMKRPPKNKSEDDPYIGPCIMFPHYWKGRLMGWQNRWLGGDRPPWCKKYTNTSDFPKDETLYNYDNALGTRTLLTPVIVESVPTVLFLESCGIPAVATFGASVTENQMRLLRRFQEGVILAFDNDGAGEKATDQLKTYLKRFIPVYHLPPVEGTSADLGDLAPDQDALFEHLELITDPLRATIRTTRSEH